MFLPQSGFSRLTSIRKVADIGFKRGSTSVTDVKTCAVFIIFPRLRPSDLLRSHASVCRVCPKIFVHLVDNEKFEMGFLSEEFEEHEFSS
jgi:hypothetical protein